MTNSADALRPHPNDPDPVAPVGPAGSCAHRHRRLGVLRARFRHRAGQRGVRANDVLILERRSGVGGPGTTTRIPVAAAMCRPISIRSPLPPTPTGVRRSRGSPRSSVTWSRRRVATACSGRIAFDAGAGVGPLGSRASVWELDTARGSLTADVLISGGGGLSEPSIPDLTGADDVRRHVVPFGPVEPRTRPDRSAGGHHRHRGLHHSVPAPRAAGGRARHPLPADAAMGLSPPQPATRGSNGWSSGCCPGRSDSRGPATTGWASSVGFHADPQQPDVETAGTAGRRYLARQVADPEIRAKLTPTYTPGCKRLLQSNDYYPALQRPNVSVEVEKIIEVVPSGVVTADGVLHEVDTIIYGTGFRITEQPHGRTGDRRRRAHPQRHWASAGVGMSAYCGATIPGFPNFFMLAGPNTGIGHTSLVVMIEAQIAHVTGALRAMRRGGVRRSRCGPRWRPVGLRRSKARPHRRCGIRVGARAGISMRQAATRPSGPTTPFASCDAPGSSIRRLSDHGDHGERGRPCRASRRAADEEPSSSARHVKRRPSSSRPLPCW